MDPKEALGKAIEIAGGPAAVGRGVGVTVQAVVQWQKCPPQHVLALERLARRRVKKHELRPDLYPPPAARAQTKTA